MKKVYPVLFTFLKDSQDTVLIEVPSLEILSEGYGLANAIEMARDAIELTLVTFEDKNMVVPEPANEADMNISDGTFAKEGHTIISLVDVDSSAYRRKNFTKSVKCDVSLPSWLHFETKAAGINLSAVLQGALIEKLGYA